MLKGSGSLCEETTIKLPLGAGSITFHAIDCPVSAGQVQVVLDADIAGKEESNSLINIDLTATADNGDNLICMNIQTQSVEEEVAAPTEVEYVNITVNGGNCPVPGDCGRAYGACCLGFGAKGYPCGCVLQPGSGNAGSSCGDCGASFAVCCTGFAAKGYPCGCDVQPDSGMSV